MKKEIKNVILILGGVSAEREVSLSSSKSIFDALQKLDLNVNLIDPILGSNQYSDLTRYFESSIPVSGKAHNYLEAVSQISHDKTDVVFNGLHGKWGEDGIIQSLLELRGLKYTGSKVLASSLSMNKHFTKLFFKQSGVSTPRWISVDEREIDFAKVEKYVKETFNFPCVVKPNDQGSAIGLSICGNSEELLKGLKNASVYSNSLMIEEYIEGREMTVGILGNDVFPVLEIKPKHFFYDYECKYTSGMSEYIIPADIPNDVSDKLQEQALLAYKSIGCENYGRIDFRINSKMEVYCLEVNTLPGMTSTSLLPKSANAVGLNFEALVERIITQAVTE